MTHLTSILGDCSRTCCKVQSAIQHSILAGGTKDKLLGRIRQPIQKVSILLANQTVRTCVGAQSYLQRKLVVGKKRWKPLTESRRQDWRVDFVQKESESQCQVDIPTYSLFNILAWEIKLSVLRQTINVYDERETYRIQVCLWLWNPKRGFRRPDGGVMNHPEKVYLLQESDGGPYLGCLETFSKSRRFFGAGGVSCSMAMEQMYLDGKKRGREGGEDKDFSWWVEIFYLEITSALTCSNWHVDGTLAELEVSPNVSWGNEWNGER